MSLAPVFGSYCGCANAAFVRSTSALVAVAVSRDVTIETPSGTKPSARMSTQCPAVSTTFGAMTSPVHVEYELAR